MTAAAISAPRRRRRVTPRQRVARWGLYGFLIVCALYFLIPLYVMLVTSFKSMDEIRQGAMLALPSAPSFAAWVEAWSSACTGLPPRRRLPLN